MIVAALHSPVNVKSRARRPFGQGILSGPPALNLEIVLSLPVPGDPSQIVTVSENPTWYEEEDPREFAFWTVRHWRDEEQVSVEPHDTFGDAELAASLLVGRLAADLVARKNAESWGPETDAYRWELGPDPDFFMPDAEDSAWLCLAEAAGAFNLPSLSGGAPEEPEESDLDHFVDDLMPEPESDLSDDQGGAFGGAYSSEGH